MVLPRFSSEGSSVLQKMIVTPLVLLCWADYDGAITLHYALLAINHHRRPPRMGIRSL